MLVKLSTCLCLEIRKQEAVAIQKLLVVLFLRMKEFMYWGTTLTNQNSIQEEIKSKLKYCHSMQNLLSCSLLSKNIKIKIY